MRSRFASPPHRQFRLVAVLLATALAGAGCHASVGQAFGPASPADTPAVVGSNPTPSVRAHPVPGPFRHPLPGMPASQPGDVFAFARGPVPEGRAKDPAYLYVPNSYGQPITTVIDQKTHQVVRILQSGTLSQHVTPSYDMKTLYVEASASDRIDAIDPRTGKIVNSYPVDRPYNLYFTPDGKHAIVMDEQHEEIVFSDPTTFRRQKVVTSPRCVGPNHADFSANGRYFVVSCEFSGTLLRISTQGERITGHITLPAGSKPQDVRISPDGTGFYVADMGRDLLLRIPWNQFRVAEAIPTLSNPHGIYVSKDGQDLYVSARKAAAVQVFSLKKQKFVDVWHAPAGATPDMGGLSADGKTLWLASRYGGRVYGWNTRTGKLIADIYVGGSPHGILVWPQPGRYSLGHTGSGSIR